MLHVPSDTNVQPSNFMWLKTTFTTKGKLIWLTSVLLWLCLKPSIFQCSWILRFLINLNCKMFTNLQNNVFQPRYVLTSPLYSIHWDVQRWRLIGIPINKCKKNCNIPGDDSETLAGWALQCIHFNTVFLHNIISMWPGRLLGKTANHSKNGGPKCLLWELFPWRELWGSLKQLVL